MEKEVLEKYYLKEFLYLDGAYEIIFNIVDINFDKKTINVAVTKCGGISVRKYDLHQDEKGNWYFNYGIMQDKTQINKKITLKIMLLTGIRKGEMSGLRWSDINFENKTIHIQRNRLYSMEKKTYEKEPKTKTSTRYIPIPDNLVNDLKEYYEWFKEADKYFVSKLDEYYIVSTITREPAPTSAPYNWLCEFLRKNNLKHLGCHGLRHTYCSLLLSQNVPIQTVSKYMGHSDSTVTLKVYSHFIPDTQDKVLSVLNNLS